MKSLLKGIASFDHLLTEDDVLRHNGVVFAEQPDPAIPAQETEAAAEPSPDDVPLSDAALAAELESGNSKAALVAMAEAAGVDQSGNKSELSSRLVSHYRSKR